MNSLPPLNVPCWVKARYVSYDTDGDSHPDFKIKWHVATRRLSSGQSTYVVCTGNSRYHTLWEVEAWEPIERPNAETEVEVRQAQLEQKELAWRSIENSKFSVWLKSNPKTKEIKRFKEYFGGVK